jgi:hypothetical protein
MQQVQHFFSALSPHNAACSLVHIDFDLLALRLNAGFAVINAPCRWGFFCAVDIYREVAGEPVEQWHEVTTCEE